MVMKCTFPPSNLPAGGNALVAFAALHGRDDFECLGRPNSYLIIYQHVLEDVMATSQFIKRDTLKLT